MKTTFVIQIVQLDQYGTKLANPDFFLILADFDPANIGVFSRFCIGINDKIDMLCHCCLMRQNRKETKVNKNAEEMMAALVVDYIISILCYDSIYIL